MNDLTQEEKIELLREALKRADYWLPCGYDIRHEDYEMNNRLIEDNQFIRKALNATDSPSDDPTPCCYQHGVGVLEKDKPCPEIADND